MLNIKYKIKTLKLYLRPVVLLVVSERDLALEGEPELPGEGVGEGLRPAMMSGILVGIKSKNEICTGAAAFAVEMASSPVKRNRLRVELVSFQFGFEQIWDLAPIATPLHGI